MFYVCLQAESDARDKDRQLSEALERMRQYEAVSINILSVTKYTL